MNTVIRIILTFAIFIALGCSDEAEQSGCVSFQFPDTYQFPVRPGSPQWAQLKSRSEMIDVQQIPENILESISTDALIETLLDCPSLLDYIAFEEFQKGLDRIVSEINGFEELYSRSDLPTAFLKRLELMNPHCQNIYPPRIGEDYIITDLAFQAFDLLIFHDRFILTLSEEEQKDLFIRIYDSLHERKEEGFNDYSLLVAYALLGKLMIQLNYSPFIEKTEEVPFMKDFCKIIPIYRPIDVFPIEIIDEYIENYINEIN